MRVKVGCTVLFIQASCESACARAQAEAGSKPAAGKLRSRKSTMATIWLSGRPSATSTGTWPLGLISRYSGVFCSPLCSLTSFASKSCLVAALIASSATCGTNEQAPGAKYSSSFIGDSLAFHFFNFKRTKTEFRKNGLVVRAQRGYRVHARLEAVEIEGRLH